jgi:hypothetical protein
MLSGQVVVILFIIGLVIGGAVAWYKMKHPSPKS